MSIFKDFLDYLFGVDDETGKVVSLNGISISDIEVYKNLWAYRYALSVVAEHIGAILSRCDFKTYRNGEEKEGDFWYMLNVEPNPNQTAAEFRKQLVRQLIFSPTHDALIVLLDNIGQTKEAMYVATEWNRDEKVLVQTGFQNVVVDIYGDSGYQLTGTFGGHKAIYIKYGNEQLESIFSEMMQMFKYLVNNAEKAGTYRQKYVLSMEDTAMNDPNFEANMQNILDEQFKAFIEGDNAVLPLYAGMKLNQVSAGSDLGQNASTANKAVESAMDDAISKVGLAFNIPNSVMLGKYEADDLEHFLTFCIDPIADMITQSINRKYYGKMAYLSGTRCLMDTKNCRHYDFMTISTAVNKIISSGVYTINEVRKQLGETPIDPAIGDVHWITRNYAIVGDYIQDPDNVINPGGKVDYAD